MDIKFIYASMQVFDPSLKKKKKKKKTPFDLDAALAGDDGGDAETAAPAAKEPEEPEEKAKEDGQFIYLFPVC